MKESLVFLFFVLALAFVLLQVRIAWFESMQPVLEEMKPLQKTEDPDFWLKLNGVLFSLSAVGIISSKRLPAVILIGDYERVLK